MQPLPFARRLLSFEILFPVVVAWTLGASPVDAQDRRTAEGVAWWSEGSGPAVVLLHAFSLDRRMWDDLATRLRNHHRVIRLDFRGHGLSPDPDGEYSSYVDVAAVLDAAGEPSAWVVGLSSGSQVALDFALEFPERVDGLILASPSVSGYTPRGSFEWFAPVMEAGRREGPEGAARAWLETPLMTLQEGSPGVGTLARLVMENARVWGIRSNPDRPPDPSSYARLGEVGAPTLVIAGAGDLVDTRLIASLLGYCVPRVVVQVVPAAGHLVALERPGAFSSLVTEFLAEGGGGVQALREPPPGCGPGEDPLGPASLGPLARMVGGSWRMGGSTHRFTWGPGRRALSGGSWTDSGEDAHQVSEVLWFWHPQRQAIEGVGVAVGMGIDLFEYRTEVSGDTLQHIVRAFGPGLEGDAQTERWIFEGPDSYRWELLGPGGETAASGVFTRTWDPPRERD